MTENPCGHTEHAVRPGTGTVGRFFREGGPPEGEWETCEQQEPDHAGKKVSK